MAFPARTYRQMEVFGALRDEKRLTHFAEKMPGSPSYSFNQTSGRAKGLYYVKWDDTNDTIPQAIKDFCGYSEQQAMGAYYCIRRHTAYEHPNFQQALYAESIEQIDGDVPEHYGQSQDIVKTALYNEALFTVTYGNRPYKVLTDRELHNVTGNNVILDESTLQRYVTVEYQPAGKTERIPSGTALKWNEKPYQAAGPPIVKASADNIGTVDIIQGDVLITWYQVPYDMVPRTAIEACMGKTNLTVLGMPGRQPVFPGKTLVLLVPKIGKPYMMSNGQQAVDILYPMRYRPYGSNQHIRWSATHDASGAPSFGPAYQLATRGGVDDDNYGVYKPADFDNLFFGEGTPV